MKYRLIFEHSENWIAIRSSLKNYQVLMQFKLVVLLRYLILIC